MDGPTREANTAAALPYCLAHPQWRLSLQTHKMLRHSRRAGSAGRAGVHRVLSATARLYVCPLPRRHARFIPTGSNHALRLRREVLMEPRHRRARAWIILPTPPTWPSFLGPLRVRAGDLFVGGIPCTHILEETGLEERPSYRAEDRRQVRAGRAGGSPGMRWSRSTTAVVESGPGEPFVSRNT